MDDAPLWRDTDYIHMEWQNGQHKVLICDPARLASAVPHTDDERFVTCFRCLASLANTEENKVRANLRIEMVKNANRKLS